MNSLIQKAFPVPRALRLSDAAIDITDGELRFFEFSRKGNELRPRRWGTLPFPRVHGAGSEERTPEAASVLKKFAASHGYQAVECIIHEGDAYIFKLKVPTLIAEEIRPAIESSLEENVPIPPAETIFEYERISVDTVRGETTVAVSAVSEKVVDGYRKLLESGSLVPVSFQTESHAIARAIIKLGDQAAHAVLCIKGHHTAVFIVEKGTVTFSSSIEVGSTDIEKAQAKAFPDGAAPTDDAALFDALLPVFSTLRDELGKVLTYYKNAAKKDESPLELSDVVLLGSSARIPGFARYISITSKLPVRIGSVWTNVFTLDLEIPELDEASSLDYGALIGTYL